MMAGMARTKNQGKRRAQVVEAAQRAIVKRGIGSVRLHDVATEAGLTSGAVLYYYDEISSLFSEVHQQAIERFCVAREDAVNAQADPYDKLVAAIRCGLPTGPGDDLVRTLYEFEGPALRDRAIGALNTAYFERQVSIYNTIITGGQATGAFHPATATRAIARNIVALEDGYGFYVMLPSSDITASDAQALILAYAESALGLTAPAKREDRNSAPAG